MITIKLMVTFKIFATSIDAASPVFVHGRLQRWKSIGVILRSSLSVVSRISSIVWNCFPFIARLYCRNLKKLHGLGSGKYGGWGIAVTA